MANTYQRSIAIDHTKVPNTDQTNFPVLISGTYSYLATIANGGNVQNSNGYDVIFTSDSGCATKLNHEVETYNATTGAVNYWVKVPTEKLKLGSGLRFAILLPLRFVIIRMQTPTQL